jgi:hypothetical protein
MRVQFVYGDADVITTPEQNRAVASERPDAPVHVLPGAGHALYLEQPEAFNALLVRFIGAIGCGGGTGEQDPAGAKAGAAAGAGRTGSAGT